MFTVSSTLLSNLQSLLLVQGKIEEGKMLTAALADRTRSVCYSIVHITSSSITVESVSIIIIRTCMKSVNHA